MSKRKLIRASSLEELYEKSGWKTDKGANGDLPLADFIFQNLRGSHYADAGYGSVEEILAGDIEMIRRLALSEPGAVHIYTVIEPPEIQTFMLWCSLMAGGLELLPPDERRQPSALQGFICLIKC